MTTETVEAIFEQGHFRLVGPARVLLREGQRVRIVIETDESPDEILALAANVYTGLSSHVITEVEQVALQRRNFFGDQE